MFRRAPRLRKGKAAAYRNFLLRCERLEPRTMCSASPPTLAHPITVSGGTTVTGATALLSVLGNDAAGASKLTYNWSVTSEPAGASAHFSASGTNAAQNTTVSFSKAGAYGLSVRIVDPTGLAITTSMAVSVTPTLTSIRLTPAGGSAVAAGGSMTVSGTSQTLVAQGLDQFGNVLASQPTFRWSTTSTGGAPAPVLSGSGSTETFSFSRVGSYVESVQATSGRTSITASETLVVAPKLTYFTLTQLGAATVTGTTAQFTVSQFQDQFHNSMAGARTTWAATTVPSGASVPTFAVSGATTTASFKAAGSYVLTATEFDSSSNSVSHAVVVTVGQTLSSITVAPNAASVAASATQQFTARALDQFGKAMQTQPTFTWSASAGSISSTGLLTAPATGGSDTITAHSGSVSGAATITVVASSNFANLQNAWLAQLVQSLDADGSISRNDMLQILDAVVAKGSVTSSEFSDLKTIVGDSTLLNMPGYVQVLASDVVNGNAANATYQGQSLGNLASGSSATQLNDLVGKWFLGTDLPTLTSSSFSYQTVSGSLFATTPSHNDEFQGELGDCYFISSLGTIADKNPLAVEDMFINNGDGTYTVRFYTGTYGWSYNSSNGTYSDGFANGTGTADYVTVNLSLPTYNGSLVYADFGASRTSTSNSLWIPLAEKAYAEWNQTGKEGRNNTNTYGGIEGGWMATVDAQILGHNATDYFMGSATQQQLINALASGQSVTIGTNSADMYGLYGSHAYAVTGYNSSTNTFTLYNPWGFDQPGQLTWNQLAASCSGFVAVNASGATPISGAVTKAGAIGYFGLSADAGSADGGAPAAGSASTDSGQASSATAQSTPASTAGLTSTLPACSAMQPSAIGSDSGNGTATQPAYDLAFADTGSPDTGADSTLASFSFDGLSFGDPWLPSAAPADSFYAQLGTA